MSRRSFKYWQTSSICEMRPMMLAVLQSFYACECGGSSDVFHLNIQDKLRRCIILASQLIVCEATVTQLSYYKSGLRIRRGTPACKLVDHFDSNEALRGSTFFNSKRTRDRKPQRVRTTIFCGKCKNCCVHCRLVVKVGT